MRAQVLNKQICKICEHHNINPMDVTIKFDNMDFDMIPEYDADTKTIVYHHIGYLKEMFKND